MEYREVVRRRRMVRSFASEPLDPGVVDRLLADAGRAPTAGHSRGTAWVVLDGPDTATYWDATTTAEWRGTSSRSGGLLRAPVVILALCSPSVYVERYGEPDKATSGLGPAHSGGGGAQAWGVPYWWGDAAFSVMTLLLSAADAGLGACFLGNFRGEETLRSRLAVPDEWRLFGAVAIGFPDGADHRSASLDRPGPPVRRVHRGRWGG